MNKKEKKLGISSWKCGECDFEVSFGKKVHEAIKILSIEEHREKHKSPKPEKKVRVEELRMKSTLKNPYSGQSAKAWSESFEFTIKLLKVLNSR